MAGLEALQANEYRLSPGPVVYIMGGQRDPFWIATDNIRWFLEQTLHVTLERQGLEVRATFEYPLPIALARVQLDFLRSCPSHLLTPYERLARQTWLDLVEQAIVTALGAMY